MIKKQNITSMLTIASFMITPLTLSASVSSNHQSVNGQAVEASEAPAVEQVTSNGGLMKLSDLRTLLRGFEEYEFNPEESFDPATDYTNWDIVASHGDARNQKLNHYLQLSMDGTGDDIVRERGIQGDEAGIIIYGITQVRYDLHAMAYYGGRLDEETCDYLVDYCSDIPYGDLLSPADKKIVAEAIISLIAGMPSRILREEDQETFKNLCSEIWEKLQDGTLWTEARSETEYEMSESDEVKSDAVVAR